MHSQQKAYIESPEKRLNDAQNKSRSSCVEIRNVPCNNKESLSEITTLVHNIEKLVNVPIGCSEIRDVYRFGGKRDTATRPIKQSFLNKIREHNKRKKTKEEKLNTESLGFPGKCQPVYTTDFAKQNSFQFCWTANGNIFLRKKEGDQHIMVVSERTLKDLKSYLWLALVTCNQRIFCIITSTVHFQSTITLLHNQTKYTIITFTTHVNKLHSTYHSYTTYKPNIHIKYANKKMLFSIITLAGHLIIKFV